MFLVYVSAILAFILFLALVSVHFLLDSERRKFFYKFFVATDLGNRRLFVAYKFS